MKATLTLTSSAPLSTRPSYNIHARSSQKPIDITCTSAPPTALTHYEVQTTNAPASVSVPESFHGTFSLHSTPYKPVVTLRDQEGVQVRTLVYRRERRGLVEGRVVEGDDGASTSSDGSSQNSKSSEGKEGRESSVVIRTSNAEARLFL